MKYLINILLISFIVSNEITFDSSRAYNYVLQQCEFGPRYPGSKGHQQCKEFLFSELSKYSNETIINAHKIVDPLTSDSVEIYNVFGRINPEKDNRVLLIAHWDTRRFADKDLNSKNHTKPVLGANDGASGVAILLSLIQQINMKNMGVDILLADAEDMGIYGDANTWAIGSRLFSEEYPAPLPQFGICVDMVADKDLKIKVEEYSYQMAPQLIQYIWNIASSKGYDNFKFELGPGIIDDHLSFSSATGIASIDLIDLDYEHWHTVNDIPENISKKSLGIVGSVLLSFLIEMDKSYE
jgi:glutaminyl-peptide cyclotransferase